MFSSSCSTHKQVACPPQQQNKYLTKYVNRIHTKASKSRTSSPNKHLNANQLSKKVKTIPAVKPSINYTDIDPISSVEARIISETPEDLIASSQDVMYADPADKIKRVSQNKVRIIKIAPAVALMTNKEQRQFNREFRKDLKESLRAAQNEALQAPAKPARGFAIAGFVTGLVSLLIFPALFGTLAIIFSGIALARLKKNPSQTGRGMAITGLILGIAGIVWAFLVVTGVVSVTVI